jgi:hypothetical protein
MADKTSHTCNNKLVQKSMTIFYDCQMQRANDASPDQKQKWCSNQNITSLFIDSSIVTPRSIQQAALVVAAAAATTTTTNTTMMTTTTTTTTTTTVAVDDVIHIIFLQQTYIDTYRTKYKM